MSITSPSVGAKIIAASVVGSGQAGAPPASTWCQAAPSHSQRSASAAVPFQPPNRTVRRRSGSWASTARCRAGGHAPAGASALHSPRRRMNRSALSTPPARPPNTRYSPRSAAHVSAAYSRAGGASSVRACQPVPPSASSVYVLASTMATS
jgi:hypothetical protein